MMDDVSTEQDMLGTEVDRIMNEFMLSFQDMAKECMQ